MHINFILFSTFTSVATKNDIDNRTCGLNNAQHFIWEDKSCYKTIIKATKIEK